MLPMVFVATSGNTAAAVAVAVYLFVFFSSSIQYIDIAMIALNSDFQCIYLAYRPLSFMKRFIFCHFIYLFIYVCKKTISFFYTDVLVLRFSFKVPFNSFTLTLILLSR